MQNSTSKEPSGVPRTIRDCFPLCLVSLSFTQQMFIEHLLSARSMLGIEFFDSLSLR